MKFLFTELGDKVSNIDAKVSNMQRDIDELKAFTMQEREMKENEVLMSYTKFCEKYPQYSFPLQTMDDFTVFDEELINETFDDLVSTKIISIT